MTGAPQTPLHHRAQLILALALLGWLMIFAIARCASARDAALPPIGHTVFCLHYPVQCRSKAGRIGTLEDLRAVNVAVNRQIGDGPEFTEHDWIVAPGRGACHDFAVTKQARLLEAGWPSAALRLAVVRTRGGEGHLVLVVALPERRVVLDSLTDLILPVDRVDYVFLSIQAGDNPRFWEKP